MGGLLASSRVRGQQREEAAIVWMAAHKWQTFSDFIGAPWSFCFLAPEGEAPGMKEEPLGSLAYYRADQGSSSAPHYLRSCSLETGRVAAGGLQEVCWGALSELALGGRGELREQAWAGEVDSEAVTSEVLATSTGGSGIGTALRGCAKLGQGSQGFVPLNL